MTSVAAPTQIQQFLLRSRAWRTKKRIVPRWTPQFAQNAEVTEGSIQDLKLACLSPSSTPIEPKKLLQKARAWTRRRRMSLRVESLQAKKEPLFPGIHHAFVEARLSNGRILKVEDNAAGAVITELDAPAKGIRYGKAYEPKPWLTNRRLVAMAKRFDLKGKYDPAANNCQHFVQRIVDTTCDEEPPRNPNHYFFWMLKLKLQYITPLLLFGAMIWAAGPTNFAECGEGSDEEEDEFGSLSPYNRGKSASVDEVTA
eukprot:CAMPEP_0206480528 /NCGR_PEP_ID=MMETSP0324_2-20121206/37414_1 /ASSEMBLY_ACC=CAM_ASM_000836 /TAXON_ID=2866 /ORGANISM="Crypthecodinium cohnii, Strain Seligo" /LENGTH=255 /DNA_ID=CAMNT_0053957465 /DNA_START=83 /DNA_END=850 /DNA_ORIENTATION=+